MEDFFIIYGYFGYVSLSPDVDDSCRTHIIYAERTAESVRVFVFDLVFRTWCTLRGISCRY